MDFYKYFFSSHKFEQFYETYFFVVGKCTKKDRRALLKYLPKKLIFFLKFISLDSQDTETRRDCQHNF